MQSIVDQFGGLLFKPPVAIDEQKAINLSATCFVFVL